MPAETQLTIYNWLWTLVAFGGMVIGILSPIASFIWSKRYRAAKEAEISALKQQIVALEKLSPKHVWEQYEALQNLSKQFTTEIGAQLEQAHTTIEELKTEGNKKSEQLIKASAAHAQLSREYQALAGAVQRHELPKLSVLRSSVNSSQRLATTTNTSTTELDGLYLSLAQFLTTPPSSTEKSE